jgi:hypothetical protein
VTAILVGVVFGMSWLSINVLHKWNSCILWRL